MDVRLLHRFRAALTAVVAAALVCLAVPVQAELVRFELGVDPGRGVPRSYEDFRRRAESLGYAVQWSDPSMYDPYYSVGGGATYGSIAVTAANDTITITWVEFDDAAAAQQQEQELFGLYGTTGYLQFVRSGRIMVQTYSHAGDPAAATRILQALVGP